MESLVCHVYFEDLRLEPWQNGIEVLFVGNFKADQEVLDAKDFEAFHVFVLVADAVQEVLGLVAEFRVSQEDFFHVLVTALFVAEELFGRDVGPDEGAFEPFPMKDVVQIRELGHELPFVQAVGHGVLHELGQGSIGSDKFGIKMPNFFDLCQGRGFVHHVEVFAAPHLISRCGPCHFGFFNFRFYWLNRRLP